MYRILGLVVVALCIVMGCKPADGCDFLDGLFGGGGGCGSYGGSQGSSYGGCSSYGSQSYAPSYGGCGEVVISSNGCPDQTVPSLQVGGCCPDQTVPSLQVQIGGCCPDQTVPQTPCDPVEKKPNPGLIQDAPLSPQEPNPKMTPVEDDSLTPELIMPGYTDATIKLRVPSNSIVLINGYKTKKTGTTRTYRSIGLRPGRQYRYTVEIQTGLERKIGTFSLQAGGSKQFAYNQFHPLTNTTLVQR